MTRRHRRPILDDLPRLVTLSPSESTPLWMALAREQSVRRRPADLARQFVRDGFVQPSALDQRMAHALDGMALDSAADFEALLLSPVAPLGACSVLAPTSQDRTLSSSRGTEVVSDPTNVLALACAGRLQREPRAHVRLCTVHQVLRAQALPPGAGFSRHFRLFALAQAGLGEAAHGFEVRAVAEHVGVFDDVFDASAAFGCHLPERRVRILTSDTRRALGDRVAESLAKTRPHLRLERESLDSTYYAGLRVLQLARTQGGHDVPIADTGCFDWIGQLLDNRKYRFVASGMGLQLLPMLYRAVT